MAHRVSGADDPYLGLVLDRQFRLVERIGEGAMARVYRAEQFGVARSVAVKILRRELLHRPDLVLRFRHEAELAARLIHPHVVIVHTVGEVPASTTSAEPEPYVVLELLEGPSLTEALRVAGGSLPLRRALHIVLALSDAVGEAHAHGIVHRDLKPDNVILVQRGDDEDFVKLVDFGLAKAKAVAADPLTREGSILGTPKYVSPEGAEGMPVTPAADCYALATLLYECLAGRTPFEGESAVSVLAQHVHAQAPDVRSWDRARAVPEPLARVLSRNLEKKPELRAQDARAFGRALVAAAREAGIAPEDFGLSSTLLGTRTGQPGVELQKSPASSSPALLDRTADAAPERSHRPAAFSPTEPLRPVLLPKRRPWLQVALFVACFLMGAIAAAAFASSAGRFRTPDGKVP